MTTEIKGRCQWKGCRRKATDIASGRRVPDGHPGVGRYCDPHAEKVKDEGTPEYDVICPNCGCRFGVN